MKPAVLLSGLAALIVLLVLSGVGPYDRATWVMEVFPIVIAVPLMWVTYRRFPLTPMLYAIIWVHAVILLVGGAYTYARVPLGFAVADWFGLDRNPYDKLGHLFQGITAALVAREVLVRGAYVRGRVMLGLVVVCMALALSATYEFVEWGAALAFGSGADEFLGTQGDPWDTQSDMLCAVIGALVVLALSKVHDRQVARFARATVSAAVH
ncbi:MAG: DUF2238 domain-containing protein [Vicinamibacterales bacterium]